MNTKELMTIMVNTNNNPYNYHHHSDPFSSISAAAANDDDDQKTSLGFMELLGYQDYYSYPSSMFDNTTTSYDHQLPLPLPPSMDMNISTSAQHLNQDDNRKEEVITAVDEVEEESSVVLNGHPSSPNSCSVSSPAAHQQCIKEKGGTKKKKKEKEARFAFMTRTEIDHLDDGYRWRKYGQKAVKNSHFPRSYYRCTSASCNVKKRVERCMGDSSYVITTYEGQHNHPVIHNSPPLIPSYNHLITTTTTAPPAMLKLEQEGLLQDVLPCYN
ncbi:putative transcription factor WRKY family [Helianthus annuus]|nr:putative transcription factor WRKY family [Helianthus annuus]